MGFCGRARIQSGRVLTSPSDGLLRAGSHCVSSTLAALQRSNSPQGLPWVVAEEVAEGAEEAVETLEDTIEVERSDFQDNYHDSY